jgi:ribosomal protein L24
MKSIYILLLLLTTTLFAGYGYNTASVDIYDIDTGFYYKSISKKQKKSGFIISKASDYQISNINIYNPKTNKSRMIFKTHNQNIIDFLFEMEYYKKSISFNQAYEHIKNNNNIEKRTPKDKLLIATYNKDTKETTLWSCNKDGENLKKITIVKDKFNWHIDVKNSKIMVIYSRNEQFQVKIFDW